MITENQLNPLLNSLGFQKSAGIYRKAFGTAVIEVDSKKREIRYPEAAGLVINERQTCNFDANENFVVLECVCRLLDKGYKAEHIELEPKWKLGRGASGGRADILVKDHQGRPLLLIECKTAGAEFKRAWNKTLQDGDQLFSYAQQISETQFLCLYTTDLEGDHLNYTSHIIAHRDNDKYLADNPKLQSFKTAADVQGRHAIWRDTYKLDYTTKGLFEANIQPYHIGKDKYSLADLQPISAADQQKKYHEFATILRQHNVSGRENAFDKLVNLFLCKLVDEIENPGDLKFYWKGVAYDTHFELMDRLQQLYQAGMGKFLGEDITYISQGDISRALRFIRKDPDATQREVWGLFFRQKFFTNNDFSLIDVHNEKLFYQNAEVLLQILQMWQDIRLTKPDGHNQFLGDMFEGFLDQGVKQSEGQFFTPMPICRFILQSLPLQALVQGSSAPPKAIDYACGAGHFLTELALQLKPLVQAHQPTADLGAYHSAIYGIEKEYRLSKVAKVSAFMYGQQGINICYGDGLQAQHSAFPAIQNNSFDLLVANPPYSVKGFLETLPEDARKAYTLSSAVGELETADSIQTFFIERAQQLLRTGGVAAIILPSSILSNGGGIYVRTREILIQYFDLIAVVEFGSRTFSKTDTNTVTLFLRRKATAPDTATHYRERVDEWFRGAATDQAAAQAYQDEHLLAQYCAHIAVPLADYQSLLAGQASGAWEQHAHFEPYLEKFNASTDLASLYKAPWFKKQGEAEQQAEIDRRYLALVQGIERDKLYHFVMASSQRQPVLIIRSPNDTKEQKQFLGYDWSSSKGNEGIKLNKDAQGRHLTPLYDEADRDNPEKLNSLIAANFGGSLGAIPQALQAWARTAALVDMLDFSRFAFEKQINLTPFAKNAVIASQFPLVRLGDIGSISRGASPRPIETYLTDAADGVPWIKIGDIAPGEKFVRRTEQKITNAGAEKSRRVKVGDFIVSNSMSVGRPYIVGLNGCVHDGWLIFSDISAQIHRDFLFYVLSGQDAQTQFQNSALGGVVQNLNIERAKSVQIPLPPLAIQQQIVAECEAVDAQIEQARQEISAAHASIEEAITKIHAPRIPLSQLAAINPSKTELRQYPDTLAVSFVEMASVSEDGFIAHTTVRELGDLRKGSYTYFAENDILIAKITPCMENGKCALATGLSNGVGMGSTEFHVFRAFPEKVSPAFLFVLLNRKVIREAAAQVMTGSSGHRRVPANFYANLLLAIPSLTEQQRTLKTIEKLEKQIHAAQAVIDAAPAAKQAILQKHL